MIDSAFDIIKFQIINSILTINYNDLTLFKIFSFFIFYIFYTTRYELLYQIKQLFNNKNSILIEGKRHINTYNYYTKYDELYSIRFKAIWYYVNNNISKLNIKSVKEFSSTMEDLDNNNKFTKSNYIVNQYSSFEISKGIYCHVIIYNDDNSNNNTNNNSGNSSKNSESTILIEIYSYKKKIYEIENFISNIVTKYEEDLKISRYDKLFIYTLEFKNNNYCEHDSSKNYLWREIEFKSNKNFNNLFFKKKEHFIDKIDFFIIIENFYIKNGIYFRILLEGKPGTGIYY